MRSCPQNKVQDPAKLRRLISLMDGETWLEIDADVKGDFYEGLKRIAEVLTSAIRALQQEQDLKC
jgi:hypothetical protein